MVDLGVAMSADGRTFAFGAIEEGKRQIYVRALDELEARPVPGTEGGIWPKFSFDGRWLLFTTQAWSGAVRKVPISGGPVVGFETLHEARGYRWDQDDTILAGTDAGLLAVPAAGGQGELLFSGLEVVNPRLLPGRQWIRMARDGDQGINRMLPRYALAARVLARS